MNGKKKIRLLYFHPTIVFGGAERTTTTLLSKLNRENFEIIFVTKKDVFPPLSVREVIYIDDLGANDSFKGIFPLLKDAKIMIQLIKKERPDIVFGMLHYACIVLSAIKILLKDKVTVIASPRTPSKDAIHFYLKDKTVKKIFWNLMVRFFCRYSDCVVVASHGLKEECITHYKAGRDKVVTINNSVDVQTITNLSKESVTIEGYPGSYIISTAGRLAAEKKIDVLLKAFALCKKDLNAKLWIVGDGPERPYLESLAANLQIKNDVEFLGYQENPYKFIRKSDLFVHTSLFEGFGNIILEAMACRVPVIATDCPFGPGEIITHMENGFLAPVSDEIALMEALKKVLTNAELRRKFIDNAWNRLKEFSVEKMVRKYEDIFINVQKGNKPF